MGRRKVVGMERKGGMKVGSEMEGGKERGRDGRR